MRWPGVEGKLKFNFDFNRSNERFRQSFQLDLALIIIILL